MHVLGTAKGARRTEAKAQRVITQGSLRVDKTFRSCEIMDIGESGENLVISAVGFSSLDGSTGRGGEYMYYVVQ